jgi:hypothetical protein
MGSIRSSIHLRDDVVSHFGLLSRADGGVSEPINELIRRYYVGLVEPEIRRLAKLFSEAEWNAMRSACNGTAWTAESIRGGVLANVQDSLPEEIASFGADKKDLEQKLAMLNLGQQFALVEAIEAWWAMQTATLQEIRAWTMRPRDADDPKAEFAGHVIKAPSERMAWKIVFGLSGVYGIPGEDQYELERGEVAYTYKGSEEAWLEAVRAGEIEG